MEKNKKPNLCSNTSWCTMIRVRRMAETNHSRVDDEVVV